MSDNIYGLDFEDCREGLPEQDIGRFCAFLLTYIPSFTPFKINAARQAFGTISRGLGLNRKTVLMEIEKELTAISRRRRMEVPHSIEGLFE